MGTQTTQQPSRKIEAKDFKAEMKGPGPGMGMGLGRQLQGQNKSAAVPPTGGR
jgi:hypothetical protein